MPVVTRVSQATRPAGSRDRMASSTASEIRSATLSGWPSVTDSEVKRWGWFTTKKAEGRRRKAAGMTEGGWQNTPNSASARYYNLGVEQLRRHFGNEAFT